jgi:hypothetical protein
MPAADKSDKNLFDQVLMPDDNAGHLSLQIIEGTPGALHSLFYFGDCFHDPTLLCRSVRDFRNLPWFSGLSDER